MGRTLISSQLANCIPLGAKREVHMQLQLNSLLANWLVIGKGDINWGFDYMKKKSYKVRYKCEHRTTKTGPYNS